MDLNLPYRTVLCRIVLSRTGPDRTMPHTATGTVEDNAAPYRGYELCRAAPSRIVPLWIEPDCPTHTAPDGTQDHMSPTDLRAHLSPQRILLVMFLLCRFYCHTEPYATDHMRLELHAYQNVLTRTYIYM